MSKLVSLSKVRKTRARSQRKAQADANAVKFGRSNAAKKAEATRSDQARRSLDGHKRET